MKSHLLFPMTIVVMFALSCGGGGGNGGNGNNGGNLVVGNIAGPTSIVENSSAQFTVAASGDTGIKYLWACDPASAGWFANQTSATTTFSAASVTTDTAVTIRVTVNSDHYGPILKNCGIIVLNAASQGWTRTWGGAGWDAAYGFGFDSSGNMYVTGVFMGSFVDFDPGSGTDQHSSHGGYEAYLTKFDPGGGYLWTRTWGGVLWDQGSNLVVDRNGNVYVAGWFQGTSDFDPGDGYDWRDAVGDLDAFISKLNSSGDWQWSRTWGGVNWDKAWDVAVDYSGDIYVTGAFSDNVDFDPGPGVQTYYSAVSSTFLSKFESSGDFDWVRTWPAHEGHGVALDSAGNTFVAGIFWGNIDFNPGPGTDMHSSAYTDMYLSKLDSSGDFQWARTWGGGLDFDNAQDVAIDGEGNIYVTGHYTGLADFDPSSGADLHQSCNSVHGEPTRDVFVSKLDSYGNFQWAHTWGGNEADRGYGVAVDGPGNVYITGYFMGTADFDPGGGISSFISSGGQDFFVSKLGASGSYKWTVAMGGSLDEAGWGIGVDSHGNVYLAGLFRTTVDFDPGAAVDNRSSNGEADIFLTKIVP